jgi:hypothetical protein
MKHIDHARSRETEAWLKREIAEQKTRYRKIVAEQDSIAAKRDRWINEFLHRIQTSGYFVHYDQRHPIPAHLIPKKPKRKFRVVF